MDQTTEVETTKKKLLIASDNILPRWDGIARFLSEIIPRLKMHYDITVVAPDFGPYEDSSITLIKIPVSTTLQFGDFKMPKLRYWKIRKAVKQADLVFTQTIGPIGGLAVFLARRLDKPLVSFIHSIEYELAPKALSHDWQKKYAQYFSQKWMRYLYAKPNLLIVPSQGIGDVLAWQHIHTPTKEVHLGVDTARFSPAIDKAAVKAELHFEPEDIIIGYHGRISHEKDLLTLFRAFMQLQGKHPHLKLLLVGDGVEELKNILRSRKGVILAGAQSNPEKYLQAMDIYVLPSLTETTSLSTLEAMSCGLPVVATEVGFVKDYIKPGFNGLFFPKQQTYFLNVQLKKLIESVQLRKFLGGHARETIIDGFQWNQSAKGIEEALEEACTRWAAHRKSPVKTILDRFEKKN